MDPHGRSSTPAQARASEAEGDESDPEDPKYLAKLSSSFSHKLKQQKNTIQVMRNILLNKQVAETAREAELKVLRRQVKKLQALVAQSQVQQKKEDTEIKGTDGIMRGPEAVFVPELWHMVFDSMENTQDLFNCYNACEYFQSALSPSRQTWMFSLILPYIIGELDQQDILNSRSVCKRWLAGVDRCLEHYNCRRPYSSSRAKELLENRQSPFKNVLKGKDLNKIMNPHLLIAADVLDDLVDPPGDNLPRIPGKTVKFHYFTELQDEVEPAVFWQRATNFVRIWGSNLWDATFVSDGSPEPTFFHVICELLAHLPNLRHLGVAGKIIVASENFAPNAELLPDLPHLKSLTVLFTKNNLKMDQALFSKYSSQLGKLETSKWNEVYSDKEMPHLTELKVYLESWGQQNRLPTELREFQGTGVLGHLLKIRCKAPIQKLALGPIATEKCVLQLFELLNLLPNLGALQLWFGSANGISKTAREMMSIIQKLPAEIIAPSQLHTLEVDQSFKQLDYVFLTWFPFLQQLHIRHEDGTVLNNMMMDMDWGRRPSELVQVQGFLYRGRMYDSNIWKMLPNLRVITYLYSFRPAHHHHPEEPERFYWYDREMYEQLKSRKVKSAVENVNCNGNM